MANQHRHKRNMKPRKILASFILLVFTSLMLITSCIHEPIEQLINPNDTIADTSANIDTSATDTSSNDTIVLGNPCSPDSVYFNQQVLPFLISNCGMNGCHSTTSHKDGVTIASYSTVRNSAGVSPGNATGSDLYKVLVTTNPNKRMPPPPAAALSQQQIDLIKLWINQGALNLSCDDSTGNGGCDTSNITYSGFVQGVLTNSCVGCHNASSANGGVELQTYAGVAAAVNNGTLLGTIKHANGFSPMPQYQSKLDQCTIAKIEAWVNSGAQNN